MTATTATAAATTEKRFPWTPIEEQIEKELAIQMEDWELDLDDINEIRLEIYKANGWSYDPFPEEPEEEEEEEDYDEDAPSFYDFYGQLRYLGMSIHDFI